MIGIVAVGHGRIACEMLDAALRILPGTTHIKAVAVETNEPPDSIKHKVSEAVKGVNKGGGVLILSDMFGGTPSNICLSFLDPPNIEVVSGFNLPMLIKLAGMGEDTSLSDAANFIHQYGQRNIVIASEVLAGKLPE